MAAPVRTYVYVDGFNLYYRALRRTRFKWLDLHALSQSLLGPEHEITHIRYFTARVSGKLDPNQPIRQQRYLQALSSLPAVSVHLGNFVTTEKFAHSFTQHLFGRHTSPFGTARKRART